MPNRDDYSSQQNFNFELYLPKFLTRPGQESMGAQDSGPRGYIDVSIHVLKSLLGTGTKN